MCRRCVGLAVVLAFSFGIAGAAGAAPAPTSEASAGVTPSGRITNPPLDQLSPAMREEYENSIRNFGAPVGPRLSVAVRRQKSEKPAPGGFEGMCANGERHQRVLLARILARLPSLHWSDSPRTPATVTEDLEAQNPERISTPPAIDEISERGIGSRRRLRGAGQVQLQR